MIKRDLLINSVNEFYQSFSHIENMKGEGRWPEVTEIVANRLKGFLATREYDEFINLSDGDILVELVKSGATFWVPYKTAMVVRLLKEGGDLRHGEFTFVSDKTQNVFSNSI